MNCWIRTISYARSTGYLRTLYDSVKGPDNNVDNVMKAHSLRPHTMEGHSGLYRSVLHHTENSLPGWLLEALGVYTSMTNKCNYSVTHHFVGLSRLLGDQERADAMYKALAAGRPEDVFAGKELALFRYVRKLTKSPYELVETDIEVLREAGAEDGEILEANQVCAYFNYSNRLLNGLGVTTEGDSIGLSPPASADLDDWRHG